MGHYCRMCGRKMYAYENNYEGICQDCLDENSELREKAENKDIVICEKCYEENEITRTTCKNCGAKLFVENIEKKIERKIEQEDEIDEFSNNDEEDRPIYNVSAIVTITGIAYFAVLIIMLFISIEFIGIFLLGLLIMPIILTILNSKLKKLNKETYCLQYKRFIEKNGMKNYESVSYNNIVRIDIDTKSKLLGAYSYYEDESIVLKFSEILDFEVFENGSSVLSSRTGSAVVGGLLFGEIGAVAGASGSRAISEECTTLKLKIYTNDVKHSVVTLDFLDSSIQKTGIFGVVYEELNEVIKKMISFLKIAREENRQVERKEDKKVTVENVEEIKTHSNNNVNLNDLKELAELKEKGILTDEEFAEAKQKILSKL